MKLSISRLFILGFFFVVLVIGVVGLVGYKAMKTISYSADVILDEKVPLADMSMESVIAVVSSRDMMGEYLLTDSLEALPEMRVDFEESIADFDMFITAITDGTHDKAGNWTQAFETRTFEGGHFKGQPLKAMWEAESAGEHVYAAPAAIADKAREADQLHHQFGEACNALMAHHEAVIASKDQMESAMEIFDGGFSSLGLSLEEYEAKLGEGSANWEQKDAAMEAAIAMGKMKAIGEEYAGLTIQADAMAQLEENPQAEAILSAVQKELTAELKVAAKDFEEEARILPENAKSSFKQFKIAGIGDGGIIPLTDNALMLAMRARLQMEILDEVSTQIEATMGDLEQMIGDDMDAAMNKADNAEANATAWLIVFICVGVVAASLAAWFVIRIVSSQLSKAVELVNHVSGGDFTQSVTDYRNDELGALIESMNAMSANLSDKFKEITNGTETLSSSATELAAISSQMSTGADQTSQKSNAVATAAEEMSANTSNVAAATEQASTNVQMVATAAEEMTATINEIAQNTEKTREISDTAVARSKSALQQINELGNAAQQIGKVTETITEISEQTNLLALNATIEAARAGEAGKGFAVVANEIKELARQTADATQEVKNSIDTIQNSTTGTVGEIESISKVINDVNEMVATIASAIEEQSAATNEIGSNVAQASQGIQEVTENVAQSATVTGEIAKDIADVDHASSEMSTNSSQVNISSDELSKLSESLKNIVAQFKV